MARNYGTKGGDGATTLQHGGAYIESSGPVCGEMTYVIGSISCAACGTCNPIRGRAGERRRGYRFDCRTCKITNICNEIRFHGSN